MHSTIFVRLSLFLFALCLHANGMSNHTITLHWFCVVVGVIDGFLEVGNNVCAIQHHTNKREMWLYYYFSDS